MIINSRRYDGVVQKSWSAEVVERSDGFLVLKGIFEREIEHPHLNVIRRGTVSLEYFWIGRWYNVFRFHDPEGTFRNYYCNISMPPELTDSVLDYVDLDLDLVVDRGGRTKVLDEDEFQKNAEKFAYPREVNIKAAEAVSELIRMIGRREFPFDHAELPQPKDAGYV